MGRRRFISPLVSVCCAWPIGSTVGFGADLVLQRSIRSHTLWRPSRSQPCDAIARGGVPADSNAWLLLGYGVLWWAVVVQRHFDRRDWSCD